jgi:hypothetical protein
MLVITLLQLSPGSQYGTLLFYFSSGYQMEAQPSPSIAVFFRRVRMFPRFHALLPCADRRG